MIPGIGYELETDWTWKGKEYVEKKRRRGKRNICRNSIHFTVSPMTSHTRAHNMYVYMYDVTRPSSVNPPALTQHCSVQSNFLSKLSFGSNQNPRDLFLIQSEQEGPHKIEDSKLMENNVIQDPTGYVLGGLGLPEKRRQ